MSTTEKKPKIAICIPHQRQVFMEFAALTLMQLYEKVDWCDKIFLFNYGHSVGVQREQLVKRALAAQADYIFFIDSDMIFNGITPNEALKKLYDMQVPIASGLARQKSVDNVFGYGAYQETGPESVEYKSIEHHPLTDPFPEVDYAGLYCCLIRNEVFEGCQKPWFTYTDVMSEDAYFLLRAKRQLGVKTKVNTEVHLDHIGIFTLGFEGKIRYGQVENYEQAYKNNLYFLNKVFKV